jgi:hypothetical protein
MWGGDAAEGDDYALNKGIQRALMGRRHLGYVPPTNTWQEDAKDFGYFAINGSIRQALHNLSGRG